MLARRSRTSLVARGLAESGAGREREYAVARRVTQPQLLYSVVEAMLRVYHDGCAAAVRSGAELQRYTNSSSRRKDLTRVSSSWTFVLLSS
jgi:hypothetical protein